MSDADVLAIGAKLLYSRQCGEIRAIAGRRSRYSIIAGRGEKGSHHKIEFFFNIKDFFPLKIFGPTVKCAYDWI